MRIFASNTVKNLMGRLGIPEDEPIQNRMITNSLENAQKKIEGVNFDARKHVLGFDDVLNHQRQTLYAKRRVIIEGNYDEVIAIAKEHIISAGGDESILDAKRKSLRKTCFLRMCVAYYFKRMTCSGLNILKLWTTFAQA